MTQAMTGNPIDFSYLMYLTQARQGISMTPVFMTSTWCSRFAARGLKEARPPASSSDAQIADSGFHESAWGQSGCSRVRAARYVHAGDVRHFLQLTAR